MKERKFNVYVKDRLVGQINYDNWVYYDDYRLNEYDIDLDMKDLDEARYILIDYYIKDIPCNYEDVDFVELVNKEKLVEI